MWSCADKKKVDSQHGIAQCAASFYNVFGLVQALFVSAKSSFAALREGSVAAATPDHVQCSANFEGFHVFLHPNAKAAVPASSLGHGIS